MISVYTIYIILIFVFLLITIIKSNTINNTTPFPIDVVYSWKGEEITDNPRSSYNHELKYSLRSIYTFAPWVNKIYILTDYPKKFPSWINKETKKIVMVDTRETFPNKSYLPNSNSNAIETTIVNIKGLSEHYIYFCDDFFLGRPTSYTDFFTPDGKARVDKYTMEENNILQDKNYNLLNIEFPPGSHRMYKHVPSPQIKSLVVEFNKKYADYIHWIRTTKVRVKRGFDECKLYGLNTPCQQIHYPISKYFYSKNRAILTDNDDPSKVVFLKNSAKNFSERLEDIYLTRPLFFCINDDELEPHRREIVREQVLNFFNIYFNKKPSFEL
jgi:hypothetical protein